MPELPNWVYDLVAELEEQRELHPKLLFESGAFEGTQVYDWCPCKALDSVPSPVRDRARAIAAYKNEADKDKAGPDA
jgi:hypothetical protein